MTDFKREERYVVVKIKDIGQEALSGLRNYLEHASIPTRECVVVESDWPIYKETWENVQRLAEGRPSIGKERDALAAENAALDQKRSKHRLEAMKLAAHLELIDHPATVFIENAQEVIELLESAGDAPNIVAVREDLTKAADELSNILDSAPTASLLRLKAKWCEDKAEHFMELAENARASGYMAQADAVDDMAHELRDEAINLRQAGGRKE